MNKGAYRTYFHIGRIGFKFPRFRFVYAANPILNFLCGVICNILEYKRYRYYVLGKSYYQWGRKWKFECSKEICSEVPALGKVYWSCGLFSIVKHYPIGPTQEEWEKYIFKDDTCEERESFLWKRTCYLQLNDADKFDNWRYIDSNGREDKHNLICIDYGDFTLGAFYRTTVSSIDYK